MVHKLSNDHFTVRMQLLE